MKLSDAGLLLIQGFEGLKLTAYRDVAGVLTIGYGHTGPDVTEGLTITRERADELLRADVARFEQAVTRLVKVPLTQSQFDALVSFSFNVGAGALERSTLLRLLNGAGSYADAADALLAWNRAGGQVVRGLTRRREAERRMFLLPDTPADKPQIPPLSAPTISAPTIDVRKPMAPVLLALLPSLVSAIPQLAKLFGTGSAVAERNVAAAETVARLVVEATGAPNLQGAVESIQADPASRQRAAEAVEAGWYALVESGGGGIDGARKFNVAAAQTPAWRMPAVWVTVALLLPVYAVVGSVLWGNDWSNEIRLQVVTAVLVVISIVASYWLGSSSGSARKTDMLAGDK